jgi:hypothetical protein
MTYRYGRTWAEAGHTPPATSWRMLRDLRHRPPGLASQDRDRRHLFTSAVEQSEQFFRAGRSGPPCKVTKIGVGTEVTA